MQEAIQSEGKPDRKKRAQTLLLLSAPTLYVIVFLIIPLIGIFLIGIQDKGHFTLEFYKQILVNADYRTVLYLTIRISFIITIIVLILAYPVAYLMTVCSRRTLAVLRVCVLIPFWSSILARTYSWIVLLQNQGVVNSILLKLGIVHEPLELLYHPVAVVLGMANALLPYMILSLYSVLHGIDREYMLAAQSLGASKIASFFKVFFPLSLSGVMNGCIMVFVMSMGYYIVPALLGGGDTPMISQFISTQVSKLLNWQIGSAAAFVLLIVTVVLLDISNRLVPVDKAEKE